MDFSIRRIRRSDNPALAKIIRTAFLDFDAPKKKTVYEDPTTDDLFTLFLTEGSECWVADLDGLIAGCCGIYPTADLPEGYVELVKFYLVSTARGKGIGKELMNHCIASAKELGYEYLYLESFPQFSKAVKMYEKLGFTSIDHPLGNSGHTGCNIWMVRRV